MKIKCAQLCKYIKDTVECLEFLNRAKQRETDFTRERRMPFCDVIYFMCGSLKRSVTRELELYFKDKEEDAVSRQAFAQSREKIKPEAFIYLNDMLVKKFEDEDGDIATYRGYRLLAVDGSVIDLPNSTAARENFGFSSNGSAHSYAKGLAMTAFDVLNKITIFSELYRYDDSERRRIMDIIDDFSKLDPYKKAIFLLDRGYPSFELFHRLEENGQKYLMRVQSSFLKEISQNTQLDSIITITRKDRAVTLRVINVTLDTGENEKLITNLFDDDFSQSEFKELYARRWGVETCFNFLKSKSLIECFTGESVTAILQDFYIGTIMMNIAAIAYREQEDIINEHEIKHPCENHYKPNFSQLIADIKINWLNILLCDNPVKSIWHELLLLKRIKKFAYADIPGRHFTRHNYCGHLLHKTHPKPTA
ncbi:MAG: IS4 family transposase [Acinetobacter sp.]